MFKYQQAPGDVLFPLDISFKKFTLVLLVTLQVKNYRLIHFMLLSLKRSNYCCRFPFFKPISFYFNNKQWISIKYVGTRYWTVSCCGYPSGVRLGHSACRTLSRHPQLSDTRVYFISKKLWTNFGMEWQPIKQSIRKIRVRTLWMTPICSNIYFSLRKHYNTA